MQVVAPECWLMAAATLLPQPLIVTVAVTAEATRTTVVLVVQDMLATPVEEESLIHRPLRFGQAIAPKPVITKVADTVAVADVAQAVA